jgi:hypothetical protein
MTCQLFPGELSPWVQGAGSLLDPPLFLWGTLGRTCGWFALADVAAMKDRSGRPALEHLTSLRQANQWDAVCGGA